MLRAQIKPLCMILAALLFSSGLFLADCQAEDGTAEIEEMVRKSEFGVWRGLVEYLVFLGPTFRSQLAMLEPGETWVDLGHGNGIALRQYLVWTNEELQEAVEKAKLNEETKARLRQFHLPPVELRGQVFGIGYHTPVSAGQERLFARVSQLAPAPRSSWRHLFTPPPRYRDMTGKFFRDMDPQALKRIISSAKLLTSYYGILDYETDFLPTFSLIVNAMRTDSVLVTKMFPYPLFFGDETGVIPRGRDGWLDFEWIEARRLEWLNSFTGMDRIFEWSHDDLIYAWRRTEEPVSWRPIRQMSITAMEQHTPGKRIFHLPTDACDARLDSRNYTK